jgi:hypothetical protein
MAEQGAGKDVMELNEMRRYIQGEEEFVFTIKRTEGTVIIKTKSLDSDDNNDIDKLIKARNIDTQNVREYLKELRYLRLSYAITGMSFEITKVDTNKKETVEIKKVDISSKETLEKFLRLSLKEATVLALYTKYEEADNKIFDEIEKKN